MTQKDYIFALKTCPISYLASTQYQSHLKALNKHFIIHHYSITFGWNKPVWLRLGSRLQIRLLQNLRSFYKDSDRMI